jgi:hypothetical protein
MRRRRRRSQDVPFGFDSFLDVVANVCGIVIRLILVAWVGARSYPSIQKLMAAHPPPSAVAMDEADSAPIALTEEIERHRSELVTAQAELLEKLRHFELIKEQGASAEAKLSELSARNVAIAQSINALNQPQVSHDDVKATSSISELRQRRQQLLADVRALETEERPRKILRYQTPVSQPVQAEQFMFECRNDRVTFIDLPALQAAMRSAVPNKAELLKSQWQVVATTPFIGSFRLRYALEREPGFADSMAGGGTPTNQASYRYGISGWVLEPLDPNRGESLEKALAEGSEFRRITDALDSRQAVVTFWVYPESFGLFRSLRDHLYDRDLVVAGRPLPTEAPIAASRHGTTSRGQ